MVSYNPHSGLQGLKEAFNLLPKLDILSLSLIWKKDEPELKDIMLKKAKVICAPYNLYYPAFPSKYLNVITCSQKDNIHADYSINPCNEYKGDSYAVPAIARLMAYKYDFKEYNEGVNVIELFQNHKNAFINLHKVEDQGLKNFFCPVCRNFLRDKKGNLLMRLPKFCPYCGNLFKEEG